MCLPHSAFPLQNITIIAIQEIIQGSFGADYLCGFLQPFFIHIAYSGDIQFALVHSIDHICKMIRTSISRANQRDAQSLVGARPCRCGQYP
jgi:hypothetical protein